MVQWLETILWRIAAQWGAYLKSENMNSPHNSLASLNIELLKLHVYLKIAVWTSGKHGSVFYDQHSGTAFKFTAIELFQAVLLPVTVIYLAQPVVVK